MFDRIKELLQKNLPEAKISIGDLTGTGDHLDILIISDTFKDIPVLDQHRKVMDILRPQFQEDLHAVQLKTMTTQKALNKGLL